MDTPFQTAQNACFDTVVSLYGQSCTWKKAGGDVVERALFGDPTQQERYQLIAGRGLAHVGYNNADVLKAFIEYREGQYVGLFDLVYGSDANQYIYTGGQLYVATKPKSFFDGQTYRIYLDKAETEAVLPNQ